MRVGPFNSLVHQGRIFARGFPTRHRAVRVVFFSPREALIELPQNSRGGYNQRPRNVGKNDKKRGRAFGCFAWQSAICMSNRHATMRGAEQSRPLVPLLRAVVVPVLVVRR